MAEARLWGSEAGKGFYWEQNERREQNEGEVKNRWQSSLDDRASKRSLPKLARPDLSLRLLLSYLMVCESRLKRFRPRIRRDTGAFRCRPWRRGPLSDLSVLPILPGDRAQSDRENIDLHLLSQYPGRR